MNSKALLLFILLIVCGNALSQTLDGRCVTAPDLNLTGNRIETVSSVGALYKAVNGAAENTTIIIEPGVYRLTAPISITTDNLTVRGRETHCDKVVLVGNGMDNEDHKGLTTGFWVSAKNATIANLTISEIYNHPIQIDGKSYAPRIYNVRMVNAGQQFVKSNPNPSGEGVHNGIVEYSVMEYTDGPPKTSHDGAGTAYTNGVDVHSGQGWRIRHNRFLNFHAPDNADHLWNAAILMWRGSGNTIAENNVFINVDRAIAYGLADNDGDHAGGVIRNNLVVLSPGLFSIPRRWDADAAILVWDSPGTKVLHNTIVTNGNIPFSIESRFDSAGVVLKNNLADAPIIESRDNIRRNVCKFSASCEDFTQAFAGDNEISARAAWFVNPAIADLRLQDEVRSRIRSVQLHPDADRDFTGQKRPVAAVPGAIQSTTTP